MKVNGTEAKKFAKGEAAALKAGNATATEDSVEADFAKSLNEELKADEKKGAARARPVATETLARVKRVMLGR